MFSAIRRRLHVSPATVIAGLALVFAMSGGAYAAKKYLITSTKQISPGVLKQLQGKAGAAGAPGAAGAQGPAGPAGPAGANGANGEKGGQGEKGVQGEIGVQGLQGKEGKTGATGATGATGVSGFTETLPSKETEMGNWTANANAPLQETISAAGISFSIPLAVPSVHVVHLNQEETEESVSTPVEGCEFQTESATAKPVAPAGTLCVFTVIEESGHIENIWNDASEAGKDSPAGAIVRAKTAPNGALRLSGTWAVTAP